MEFLSDLIVNAKLWLNDASVDNTSSEALVITSGLIGKRSLGSMAFESSNNYLQSVTLTASTIFNVAGSATPTLSTIGLNLASQTANKVLASPDGASGIPVFRSIESDDITSLSWSKLINKPTINLDYLSDTIITSPIVSQYLRYNGTNWVNAVLQSSDITAALTYVPYNSSNPAGYLVWGSVISGYTSGVNSPISNTDSLLDAISKLQGQIDGVVPTNRGGTNLDYIGTANQVLKVNSSGTGLEYGSLTSKIMNSAGVDQFSYALENGIRFEGGGDTSISYDSSTKKVIITSIAGSGSGGAVTSFNGRTGGISSAEGDYTLNLLGDVTLSGTTANQLLRYNSTTTKWENWTPTFVTSVGLTMPSIFAAVAGSPVTSSGTLTVTLANQAANTVWAGPTSGGAMNPTFRALVDNDIPSNFYRGTNNTYTTTEGTFDKTKSGFKRNNADTVLGGLTIHVAHSLQAGGEHSRGITFEYGSVATKRLWTYGFDASGGGLYQNQIWTSNDVIGVSNVPSLDFTKITTGNVPWLRLEKAVTTDLNNYPVIAGDVKFETYASSASNTPVAPPNQGNAVLSLMSHSSIYGKQLSFVDTDELYMRKISNNVGGTWRKIWHDGNLTNLNQLTTRLFSDLQSKPTSLSGYGVLVGDTLFDGKYLRRDVATDYFGAGITGQTINLNIANPQVGFSSNINFQKSSDGAGLSVTEHTSDQTLYEFWMSDNPDSGDYYSWRFATGDVNNLWQPLYIGGLTTRFIGVGHSFYGNITQQTSNYYTTRNSTGANANQNINLISSPSHLKSSGSGTITITNLDISNYTGSSGNPIWIRFTSATTFDWGTGNFGWTPTPVQSGITLVAGPIVLSNGVSVTFNGTTGAVAGDIFSARLYKVGTNTIGTTSITGTLSTTGTLTVGTINALGSAGTTFLTHTGGLVQSRTSAQVLSDIAALPASSYTAADVLSKLLTVDGSGSGIDADLLDGINGANYTRVDLTMLGKVGDVTYDSATTSPSAWSLLPVGYSRMMSNAFMLSGAPTNSFGYFTKVGNRDTAGGWSGLWVGFSAGENYIGRTSTNTTYATWEKIWTDANDGAGSTLDADLLDGQQGSWYQDLTNATGTLADARLSSNVALKNSPNVFSIGQTIRASNATTATDYIVFNPSDTGVGKPYLTIKKEVIADKWTIGLWDTATSNGTIDIGASIFTKQGSVIWHQGNDGAGSGLDSDLLDGQQGSWYLDYNNQSNKADALRNGAVFADAHTVASSYYGVNGYFRTAATLVSATNFPSGAIGVGLYTQRADITTTSGAGSFYLWTESSSSEDFYLKKLTGISTWSAWRKIWTDGNQGAGSGMDSDTVDGLQASQFLRKDVDDTLNGAITLTKGFNRSRTSSTVATSTDYSSFFDGQTMSDAPNADAGYYNYIASTHRGGNINTFVLAHKHSISGEFYVGYATGTTASGRTVTWNKIWTAGNDGAGSGLDADLLDGQNGSYYSSWTNLTNKPTTLSGYSITDAAPISGSTFYINNQNSSLQVGNFKIDGRGEALGFTSTGTASLVPTVILNANGATTNNQYVDFRVSNVSKFQFGYTQATLNRFYIWNTVTASDSIRIFEATNNVALGAGALADNGYKLEVQGTSRIRDGLTIGGTGLNSKVQFGRPSDGSSSAFIGYNNLGALGDFLISSIGGANGAGGAPTISYNATNGHLFQVNNNTYGQFMPSGNFILQSGGTFTDAGYRLDVSGTTRLGGRVSFADSSKYIDGAIGSLFIINSGSNSISFESGSSAYMRMVGATGNFILQNGGTFTDAGFRLDVQGTGRYSTNLANGTSLYVGNMNASGATIVDIGDNTGTKGLSIGIKNSASDANYNTSFGSQGDGFIRASANSNGLFLSSANASGYIKQSINSTVYSTLFNTGNLLLQSGGTHTDNGYKLDVAGTTRLSGNTLINGGSTPLVLKNKLNNRTLSFMISDSVTMPNDVTKLVTTSDTLRFEGSGGYYEYQSSAGSTYAALYIPPINTSEAYWYTGAKGFAFSTDNDGDLLILNDVQAIIEKPLQLNTVTGGTINNQLLTIDTTGIVKKIGTPSLLNIPLTGFTTSSGATPIVATDTILQAFGKVQGQINDNNSIIPKTWDQLNVMVTGNTLSVGQLYKITDFRTKYAQPLTVAVLQGAVEELVVMAVSPNTFSKVAYSPNYPMDYIEYDFFDTGVYPQEGGGLLSTRNGWITFRRDKNWNEASYDIREVRVRRYKIKTSTITAWSSGANFTSYQHVYHAATNAIYITMVAITNSTVTPNSDSRFLTLFENVSTKYWFSKNTSKFNLEPDLTAYSDMLTINSGSHKIKILPAEFREIPNVMIGASSYNVTVGKECYEITTGTVNYDISFGDEAREIITGDSCNDIRIGTNCYNLYIGKYAFDLTFASHVNYIDLGYSCGNMNFGVAVESLAIADNAVDNYFDNKVKNINFKRGLRNNYFKMKVQNDWCNSTHVYNDYNCDIYRGAGGVEKLVYFNSFGAQNIADSTD